MTLSTPADKAKLILCQPLADHDGAAILGFQIVDFDLSRGITHPGGIIQVSLPEQLEIDEGTSLPHRDLNPEYFQAKLQSEGLIHYFTEQSIRTPVTSVSQACTAIEEGILLPMNKGTPIFWWESWRSFPTLRSFYNYFCAPSQIEWGEPTRTIADASSLLMQSSAEKEIAITCREDIFSVVNGLQQEFAPGLHLKKGEEVSPS